MYDLLIFLFLKNIWVRCSWEALARCQLGEERRRRMHNLSKFHKIRDRVCTSALSFKVASLFYCCWRRLSWKAGGLLVATPGHCAQIFREERLSRPAKTFLLKYQGHKGWHKWTIFQKEIFLQKVLLKARIHLVRHKRAFSERVS